MRCVDHETEFVIVSDDLHCYRCKKLIIIDVVRALHELLSADNPDETPSAREIIEEWRNERVD